ncbi:MAG TPA: type III pantothenate kinase [Rectinemataceae bacterium]|nr:type III pantothenate kinase [Rectinemataceae bacterium]
MLFAVDARNRSISLGFHEGSDWLIRRELGAMADRSADEYAWFFDRAFQETRERAVGRVDRAIVSSVAPGLTPRLLAAIKRAFGVEALLVGPGTRTGVRIRSDLPQEVGSDLVCAAAAARRLVEGPCVIVDFGDTLVFSALGPEGDFLGAAIAPGIEAAALSLHAGAALLPEVLVERPARAIGRTTQASIQSGLFHGYGGLVDRLAGLFRAELAGPERAAASIEIVATGNPAGRELLGGLEPYRFVESLALDGLVLIAALAEESGGGRQRQKGARAP